MSSGFIMDNEKIENLLNLSLNSTREERERSSVLETGYSSQEDTWEVIIKFSGEFQELLQKFPQIRGQELLYQYALLIVPESMVDIVAADMQVAYMEKPKRLFFAELNVFCNLTKDSDQIKNRFVNRVEENMVLSSTQFSDDTGKGVIIAIIDSGIDYAHPDFCNSDGSTRILELWDQTLNRVYTQVEINAALQAPTEQQRYELVPSRDISGHGTHVTGIAAGNGRASGGRYVGVAPESSLLIVKLGVAKTNGFPRTTELMAAVDYVLRRAEQYQMPVAVNLSFGNNYGGHDGRSLLETYLNEVSSYWKNVIVAGTGNEGASRIHTSGRFSMQNETSVFLKQMGTMSTAASETASAIMPDTMPVMARVTRKITSATMPEVTPTASAEKSEAIPAAINNTVPQDIQLAVGAYETGFSLQIWKSYADDMRVTVIHPNGISSSEIRLEQGIQRIYLEGTELLVYYGTPLPYTVSQEVFLDFIPSGAYVDSGVWIIRLTPGRIVEGSYDMWLPWQGGLSEGTGFLYPTEETTLTIPSTADKVISVAAYDSRYQTLADFSGRGYTRNRTEIKPDVAAPGVDIIATAPGGGYDTRTGTSMAAPYVTGLAARKMQRGIVQGEDPYLYGEKIKAQFHREARPLDVRREYPNPELGWGILE